MLKLLFILMGIADIGLGFMVMNGGYSPDLISVGLMYITAGILFFGFTCK